jgi:Putative adhesin
MTSATVLLASLLTVFGGLADAGIQPAPPAPPEAPRPPQPPRPPRQPRESRSRHEATDRQVHKLSVGRSGSLDLSNISGDVVVNAGSGDEAVVEVILRGFGDTEEEAKRQLELIYVDVIKGAQRAEIRAKYRDRFSGSGRRNFHSSADYRVTAPPDVRVTVHSVSGDVQAAKMKGELSIETVSGDVTLDSATRVSAAKSVSGDVTLTGISSEGTLAASSVSGDVTARGLKANRLELTSVSGTVNLRDVVCDGAEITSTSGDVEFAGALSKSGRYEMQSHSGTIRIELTGNTGFEVEATSFSGEVRADVPLDRQSDPDDEGSSRRGPRRRSLRGTSGDGSAILELTTFSGDIIITSAGRRQ